MAKKYNYTFIDKKTGAHRRRVLLPALISFLLLAAAIIVSLAFSGSAGSFVGAFGFCGIFFALLGFIYSIRLLASKVKGRTIFAAAIACGIMFIAWLALFLAGLR